MFSLSYSLSSGTGDALNQGTVTPLGASQLRHRSTSPSPLSPGTTSSEAAPSLIAPMSQSTQREGKPKGSPNASIPMTNPFSWGEPTAEANSHGDWGEEGPPSACTAVLIGGYSAQHLSMRLLRTGLRRKQGKWRNWKRTRERVISDRPRTILCMHLSWQNAMDGWVGNFQSEIKTVSWGNKTKIT